MKRSKYVQLSLAASVAHGDFRRRSTPQDADNAISRSVRAVRRRRSGRRCLLQRLRRRPDRTSAHCAGVRRQGQVRRRLCRRLVPEELRRPLRAEARRFQSDRTNGEAAQYLDALANAQMPAGEARRAERAKYFALLQRRRQRLADRLADRQRDEQQRQRTVYRDRDTRQTYNTSTQYRRVRIGTGYRAANTPTTTARQSKPVNVASSTSRGGFGSQSSARSGWGGWGGSGSSSS